VDELLKSPVPKTGVSPGVPSGPDHRGLNSLLLRQPSLTYKR